MRENRYVPSIERLERREVLATYVWNGGVFDSNWHNALNWLRNDQATDQPPGPSDAVWITPHDFSAIPGYSYSDPVIHVSTTIGSLYSQPPAWWDGASSIWFDDDIQAHPKLTITNGGHWRGYIYPILHPGNSLLGIPAHRSWGDVEITGGTFHFDYGGIDVRNFTITGSAPSVIQPGTEVIIERGAQYLATDSITVDGQIGWATLRVGSTAGRDFGAIFQMGRSIRVFGSQTNPDNRGEIVFGYTSGGFEYPGIHQVYDYFGPGPERPTTYPLFIKAIGGTIKVASSGPGASEYTIRDFPITLEGGSLEILPDARLNIEEYSPNSTATPSTDFRLINDGGSVFLMQGSELKIDGGGYLQPSSTYGFASLGGGRIWTPGGGERLITLTRSFGVVAIESGLLSVGSSLGYAQLSVFGGLGVEFRGLADQKEIRFHVNGDTGECSRLVVVDRTLNLGTNGEASSWLRIQTDGSAPPAGTSFEFVTTASPVLGRFFEEQIIWQSVQYAISYNNGIQITK